MSIEINGSGNRPPVANSGDTQRASASGANASENSSTSNTVRSTADTFSMTSKASQLQQLEAQIASLPVVDTQRVGEVQHALATHTLEVNPARVADKMLSFEAGLDPKE